MSLIKLQSTKQSSLGAESGDLSNGLSNEKMWLFFYGPFYLLFILIIPIFYFERTAMLAASQSIKPVFWSIFAGSIIASLAFNILRWEDLNDYFDRKGTAYFKEGFEDEPFNRFIQVPIAFTLIVMVIFVLSVGILSNFGHAEKVKTFDVVWKGSVSKQCRGYKTLPTDQYMKMHICKYPAGFAETVKNRGTVKIKGYETLIGFRGVEIVSYKGAN